jgi:hypothetical protein
LYDSASVAAITAHVDDVRFRDVRCEDCRLYTSVNSLTSQLCNCQKGAGRFGRSVGFRVAV